MKGIRFSPETAARILRKSPEWLQHGSGASCPYIVLPSGERVYALDTLAAHFRLRKIDVARIELAVATAE